MSSTRTAGTATGPMAHTPENPAPEAALSRDIVNIPDNVIQAGIKDYAEPHQDLILWAVGYARQELGNSRERLCELLDCDWTTFLRIATGKYPAGVESFCTRIADLQRRVSESVPSGFVETIVTRKIEDMLDYALAGDVDGGKIVLISGPTGRSKTETVRQWWRRNNHGRTVYVDCPESGGLRALFTEIARGTGVNADRSTLDLRDRIISSFSRRRMLIVDEVYRLLPSRRSARIPVELEFIRRLHDVKRCAVALIATPVFEHELNSGWLQQYLEQLLGRLDPLIIPERVYRSEVREICATFAPDPAGDLLDLALQIANNKGRLRVLFDLLRKAAMLAKRRKEPLSARHLNAALVRRQNRAQWPEEDAQ